MPTPIRDIPTSGYLICNGWVEQFGPSLARTADAAEEVRQQRRDNPQVWELIPRRRAAEREAELEAERDIWRDLALRRKEKLDRLEADGPGVEAR